jgi:exopolyphosphatase/guanosine-5'-triphosphate,3'-diphosphate pyrophosphatase
MSLPLGAGRMTKTYLTDDPPTEHELQDLQTYIDDVLPDAVSKFAELRQPDQVVGSSKTIRSLARLAGSQSEGMGGNAMTFLYRWQLEDWLPRLAKLPSESRHALPGITQDRAFQIVGGGTVLLAVMRALEIERLDVSPWAMREGVLLDYLDRLPHSVRAKRKK